MVHYHFLNQTSGLFCFTSSAPVSKEFGEVGISSTCMLGRGQHPMLCFAHRFCSLYKCIMKRDDSITSASKCLAEK